MISLNLGENMKIAIIQLCSALDPSINLEKIDNFIQMAKRQSAIKAVFLPEVFYSISDGTKPTPYLVEKGNEHYKNVQNLAKKHQVYLLGGTAATVNPTGGKILNRAYNFNPDGVELSYYDKIHLFAVNLSAHPSQTVIDEGVVYQCGTTPQMIEIDDWKLGLGICFDLRFPELYRYYYSLGANLLTVASAFTVPTGRAHWEVLVRARAIENQSYVVAAGQWGHHNDRIKTYGHSMIVSPWGEIIANAGDGEGYILADLQLDEIEKVRARMDVSSRLSIK
jgi:deaminated glutathione amidase